MNAIFSVFLRTHDIELRNYTYMPSTVGAKILGHSPGSVRIHQICERETDNKIRLVNWSDNDSI